MTWTSDKDGQLGTSTPTTQGEILFSTSSLTADTHTLTMTVTDEVGGTCSDLIQYTVGTVPTLTLIRPETDDVYATGAPVTFEAEASDAEDPPTSLRVTWHSSLDGLLGVLDADSAGLATFVSTTLSPGTHTLTTRVTDPDGLYAERTRNFRVNASPVVDSVTVTPSTGAVGDTLTCSATAADTDGTTPDITYAWSDGSLGPNYLVSASNAPGDVVTCTATATDDDGGTASGTATATVVNTDPELVAAVNPSTGAVGDTLTCSATVTDVDGSVPSLDITWSSGATGATYTLTAADTPGTVVTCTVTATDDHGGSAVDTASATVLNTEPELFDVTVSPSAGRVGDTLTCTAAATDADGGSPGHLRLVGRLQRRHLHPHGRR